MTIIRIREDGGVSIVNCQRQYLFSWVHQQVNVITQILQSPKTKTTQHGIFKHLSNTDCGCLCVCMPKFTFDCRSTPAVVKSEVLELLKDSHADLQFFVLMQHFWGVY